MEAPHVRYARSGDVSIAYGVVGDGPFDLVFVGGWVLSAFETAWDGPARETLTALAQFSRLILFDKRGTGLSDRDAGVPDLETRMDDIRAVMDAVGSTRAAIIGVSEGGPITLLFAATYPERTAAAILYGTGASHTRAPDYPWAPTLEDWDRILATSETPAIGSDEWLDSRLEALSPSIADDPEARAWWRKWVLMSASPSTVRALNRMNMGADVRHALAAISMPTLVIHPVGDPVWLLAEGRYIADRIPGSEMIELPGDDHGWWVRADELAGETKRFLYEIWDRGEWDEVERTRVLATVLFTDIVGSTEKLAELGDREWKALLQRHHALVRRQLVRYSGHEVDTAGDGFFASFDGPARAIRCACAISESIGEVGLQVRAGLHTGECEVLDGKVGGIAVHIGSRVAAEAGPGEVLVSSTVKDLVAGSGIQFHHSGSAKLKGLPDEWQLYSVAQPVSAR
jgi:pimeloyl-ACP methyl ester carboxylesterase/class 3 adenylate cyclase